MTGAASAFIETPRLVMHGLSPADASEEYLGWLNDPEVLRYRMQKGRPSSVEQLRDFLEAVNTGDELVLAMQLKDNHRHIGNIALNWISWIHGVAELAIMIGARDQWNRGLGREAIDAVSRHAFQTMRLHRLWAESPNPWFNAAVRALGWTHEGTRREAFWVDGGYVDVDAFGLLDREYVPLAERTQ